MANKIIQTPVLAGSTSGSVRAYGTPVPNIDPAYQELLDANPYRNLTYRKSPWQGMLEALGFRTQADAWQENMAVQAAEYDAAIKQKAYDEEYNSALSQTERLRSAGLNPDLTGGVDPGEAASLPQDPSTPMQSTGNEQGLGHAVGIAAQCLDMITGVFSSGFGLLDSAQGLVKNHLNNRLLQFGTLEEFEKFATDLAPQFLPEFPDDELIINPFDWKRSAIRNAEKFAGMRLKRRDRDRFIDSITRFYDSAPGTADAFKTWASGVKNRKEYALESQTNFSQVFDVLMKIYKPFGDAMSKNFGLSISAETASLNESISEDTDRKQYFDTLDSGLQAQVENTTNQAELASQQVVSGLNDAINKAFTSLRKTAAEGGWQGALAELGIAALAFGRLWLNSLGAPSFSRSTSVKPNGARTTTTSFSSR